MADIAGIDEIAGVLERLGKDAPKALADAINQAVVLTQSVVDGSLG